MTDISKGTPDRPASDTHTDQSLADLRLQIRAHYGQSEAAIVRRLLDQVPLSESERLQVQGDAAALVRCLRDTTSPTTMESFLAQYGLSTREGVGLMCLAEALLRVPDAETIDELIADKLEPSDWSAHLGASSSPLVNASTWALMLTSRLLDDEKDHPVRTLRPLIKRMGEPLIRSAVGQAMKLLGKQFVLGQTIDDAIDAARKLEQQGYTYSYDMLGEAARTCEDATRYHQSYHGAILALASAGNGPVRERPGISVKLSALHPRYEFTHHESVMRELLPRIRSLCATAATAGIGLNIDAEEADRLDLSLDLIEALAAEPELQNWEGLGVVVQAYGRRALDVIDWLVAVAHRYQRSLMVRLVKGAYWDSEIKQAQELGLASFPVFTRKANTDLAYLVCAARLLANREVIYPQFATHNAHSVIAVRQMAGSDTSSYEFQRLHGMGESLHALMQSEAGTRCRIYAPVGAHRDLLAYLVRRLLENGANSSFVNQIIDTRIAPEVVARCPIGEVLSQQDVVHPGIVHPMDLYQPARTNSRGFRIQDPASVTPLLQSRAAFAETEWQAGPMLALTSPAAQARTSIDNRAAGGASNNTEVAAIASDDTHPVPDPADVARRTGTCRLASTDDVDSAISSACASASDWSRRSAEQRADTLRAIADAYEAHIGEFCALACREAGKTLLDGVAEVREAVDFLRYYAADAAAGESHDDASIHVKARGVIVCISPWNFPLAIFTGQIAGALAAGNVVLAKPAEQTPLIAARAVALMIAAGLPAHAVQLLPGAGDTIGAQLTSDPRIDGVCFTGSTEVARLIERSLAARTPQHVSDSAAPVASANPMLIAETGGLNAMIVDSTALTEQVVRDVVMSAFQSAGQRCSALRMLYVQREAFDRVLTMLTGAMHTLVIGNPWHSATDVGPVIDAEARADITAYIEQHRSDGSLIFQQSVPDDMATRGHYIGPAIIKVDGVESLQREIFGPVLHIAAFEAAELDSVVDAINASGYGLTFGLHTRIDDRVQQVVSRLQVGNVYVNRNQIGAVVGSQPFGGEGLSGTGPKAGGPFYVRRFQLADETDGMYGANRTNGAHETDEAATGTPDDLDTRVLPGPTGESNTLKLVPRGPVLIMGDDPALRERYRAAIEYAGSEVLLSTEASRDSGLAVQPAELEQLQGLAAVACASRDAHFALACRQALAKRVGPIIPLVTEPGNWHYYVHERHVCIDTTAAGGNASLLGAADG